MTSGWPALAMLAAAALAWSPGGALRGHRLRIFRSDRAADAGRRRARPVPEPQRRRLLAGATGLAAGLVVGGPLGAVLAVGIAVAAERLLRAHAPDDAGAERVAVRRDLPAACDLLVVCLTAGLPIGSAVGAVAGAVPGPLGGRLRGAAGLYRLGAEPRRVWAAEPGDLAALGRVLTRAAEGGSAAVPALRTLAAEERAAALAETEAAARRAGVGVLAPLGLCFLPAFVCLGVAPLVLGLVADVFG